MTAQFWGIRTRKSFTLKRASMWRQTVIMCACRHFVLNFYRPLRLCWKNISLVKLQAKSGFIKIFFITCRCDQLFRKNQISICCDTAIQNLKELSEWRHHNILPHFSCVIVMTQSLKPIKNKTSLKALCKNAGDTVHSYWTMVNSESWFPKPCLACLCSLEGGGFRVDPCP